MPVSRQVPSAPRARKERIRGVPIPSLPPWGKEKGEKKKEEMGNANLVRQGSAVIFFLCARPPVLFVLARSLWTFLGRPYNSGPILICLAHIYSRWIFVSSSTLRESFLFSFSLLGGSLAYRTSMKVSRMFCQLERRRKWACRWMILKVVQCNVTPK